MKKKKYKLLERPLDKKMLEIVKRLIRKELGKKVISGIKIIGPKARRKGKIKTKVKTYKIIIKDRAPLRMDIDFPLKTTRLQRIANKSGLEIPKVIFVEGKYKFSEWIDGVMIKEVWNKKEVFEKLGDLVGRLNITRDPVSKQFLENVDLSKFNVIWTKDRRIYIIDHDWLIVSLNPDLSVVKILLKRIREKERIEVFLKSYSKHRNIDNIMGLIEKRNWEIHPTRPLLNEPKLI